MSVENKENSVLTPKKSIHSVSVENSPTSAKRALKPVSPNKHSNVTVGRLNFLQNDNIDSHFDHIHAAHEQLKEQVLNIEVQTKQTHVDLEQLFDRLKNNNQNLNKLLASIEEYSREVSTEGSATKSDVARIIAILEDLKSESRDRQDATANALKDLRAGVEQLISGNESKLQANVDELRQLLEKLVLQTQNQSENQRENQRELQGTEVLQAGIENTLASLLKGQSESIPQTVKTVVEENFNKRCGSMVEEIHTSVSEELTMLLFEMQERLGRSFGEKFNTHSKETTNAITAALSESSGSQDGAKLQKLVELQTSAIEQLSSKLVEQERARSVQVSLEQLQGEHDALESKLDRLRSCYLEKLEQFLNLQGRYGELSQQVALLEERTTTLDVSKLDKLHQLHSDSISRLGAPSAVTKKRIFSMPAKAHDELSESNNSDGEF